MSMNKDQLRGQVNRTEGKIKEVVGIAVGDQKLETKGKVQRVVGEVQTTVGDVKQVVKDSTKTKDSTK
jgi:uncharacterized protein YjbJ (UPF0337 family)